MLYILFENQIKLQLVIIIQNILKILYFNSKFGLFHLILTELIKQNK